MGVGVGVGVGMGVGMALRVGILRRREMNRHEVGGCNFQSLCHHYIIPPCDLQATYRRPTGDHQATNRRPIGEMLKPRPHLS